MNTEKSNAMRKAASHFVRNQPRLFAEAVDWVESLRRMKRRSMTTVGASADFRIVEGLVLHYRAVLHEAPLGVTTTSRAAYRVILTSWLLSKDAHRVVEEPGRKKPSLVRPDPLAKLPLLTGPELRVLRGRYVLDADPRWKGLVLSAWKLVDPGYLDKPGNTGPVNLVVKPAKHAVALPGAMPERVARARESYEWVRKKASHLFGKDKSKYPIPAFSFVKNPKNGCPAYAGEEPPLSHATWERYIRLSAHWQPHAK